VHLSVKQYDAIERAITHGQRIAVYRRGTEFIVIPERLVLRNRRECVEARHPTTGDHLTLWLDELDALELVR
jgi:transcriptional antiterminator Rof (Rho-off)